ncbi:sensor histidine kinase YesM [Paenibacillus marchantiophytorum]|uniref:Sensor histidine kinase YesM n=1 Tax=Paenibacillus marchantiophytorum TaxID=1619310 RepID=A0ABQ2BR43_9BACL|nr:sensor histidine kinase [Paenibacillus marchantiophytorum]GGI45608.1 sensor histidine kinase YesM [Paenibacillus marchantiophytorum]
MNPIRFFKKSIFNKIMISFLFVMIIPTSSISISSYFISVKILKEKVSDSFHENLLYIGSSIEKDLSEIEKITELIFINEDIQQAISADNTNPLDYYANYKKVDQVMNNLAFYSNYYKYVTSLFIFGMNGSDFRYGNGSDAYAIDTKQLLASNWYKQSEDLGGNVLWIGVHDNDNKSRMTQFKQVFSLARLIRDFNNRNIGSLYLSLNTNVFTDILSKASPDTQSQLYVVDQLGKIVYPQEKLAQSLESDGIILPKEKNFSNFEIKKNGKSYLVSNYDLDKYGWKIVQMVPLELLTKDNKVVFKITTAVCILSLLFSGVLWFFISAGIVKPIKKLTLTMKDVKGSNLLVKSNISNTDEIGLLSVNFNYMIERINSLFSQAVEEEAMKRKAEIKALQGQITPHFLYNTLNTIRWMAIIQKSDGIKEVVDALGRLLKNTFKEQSSLTTVSEELSMIKDYIYIQQTRYREKFQVLYEIDEQLLHKKCVKFILQPIVENAIFHGIEPREEPGFIRIKIFTDYATLQITVEDSGVGMSAYQISRILGSSFRVEDSLGGIGVHNVNLRIKMICGALYGIQIDSQLGVYTKVHIVLPLDIIE